MLYPSQDTLVFLWLGKYWYLCMDVRVGLRRKLSAEELMLLNCGVGEDSWESLGLTARRSTQSILKEISPGCSLEGMMLKLKVQYLWPPHAKSWLIGKDSDAGRDWGQEEKGTTEDEMAGWHHRLDGRASEWTPGVGDGQGGLACCDSWGLQRVGHDWATELNWVNRAQPPSYTTGELPDEQRSKHPVHCSRVSAPRMMWRGSKQALLLLLYWWTSALQWTAFGKHLWKWKILTKSLSLLI